MGEKRWTIRIDYTTGDSYHCCEGASQEIGVSWENLDAAKAALKRIGDMHKSMQYHDSSWHRSLAKGQKAPREPKRLPGYRSDYSIGVLLDDGTEQSVHMFWTGYFERLVEARIVGIQPDGDDMRFVP